MVFALLLETNFARMKEDVNAEKVVMKVQEVGLIMISETLLIYTYFFINLHNIFKIRIS